MLKGKTALITGSTSGIGLGIATAMADAGCNIVLNGLGDAGEIEKTRASLAAKGVTVTFDGANLMKADAIVEMFHRLDANGGIDILVNNAGIQFVSPIVDFPPEKWEAIISLNLSATFYATKAALPKMIEKKWGRVINIASAHGLVASPFKSAYVAAKHGVLGFTKVTALEMADKGVTANAICPGYVHTPLVEAQIDDQAKVHGIPRERVIKEVLLAKQAIKEFVTVEQLGALAVFLASDAAQTITGTSIAMDGGWTAE
jgi:3-hydroxybutyrate dehydrogenase